MIVGADDALARFYASLTPSVATICDSLRALGIDPEHPTAADLYLHDLDTHNLGMHQVLEQHAAHVEGQGAPTRDDVILDLGCGIGGTSRFLAARHGCSVIGVDVLPLRVDTALALTELTGMHDRVSHAVGDATALECDSSTFAQVWMLDVGIHVADKEAMFSEIARVLRPNGLLVLHEQLGPLPDAMSAVTRQAPYHAQSFTELVRSAETVGLRIVVWHDTTAAILAYFSGIRSMLGSELPSPADDDGAAGLGALLGYLDTFSGPDGRSGLLLARRSA